MNNEHGGEFANFILLLRMVDVSLTVLMKM